MWQFGWPVQWCRWFDGTGEFCSLCVAFNRWLHKRLLHRNPTFVHMNLPPEEDT